MMENKISVIIPYAFHDENIDEIHAIQERAIHNSNFVNQEFCILMKELSFDIPIDITLSCLESQIFEDFEVIVVSKYKTKLDKSKFDLNLKIIKDKDTIWKDSFALNNARNSGIIKSNSNLLFFLDPLNVFNKILLSEVWDNYRKDRYITCNAIRRIKIYPTNDMLRFWRKKYRGNGVGFYFHDKVSWTGTIFKTKELLLHFTWGYGFSVSREDVFRLNGFDEIYDGAKGSDDIEFGVRLSRISKRKRVSSSNLLYELYTGKNTDEFMFSEGIRDNRILLWDWTMKKEDYIVANQTKPDKKFLANYPKRYFSLHKKYPPDGWDRFMDVPTFRLEEMS